MRRLRMPEDTKRRRTLLPLLVAGVLLVLLPATVQARPANSPARSDAAKPSSGAAVSLGQAEMRDAAGRADRSVRSFYEARNFRPLWVKGDRIDPAGFALLDLLRSAQLDVPKPKKLKAGDLAKALERSASGKASDLARAEIVLSRTFAAYVKAMRAAPHAEMQYESGALKPVVPTSRAALEAAAAVTGASTGAGLTPARKRTSAAGSLEEYVRQMGWMHPLYAPLRNALAAMPNDSGTAQVLRLNLDRVRAIPAYGKGRHVLVDVANARLTMYQNGRIAGTMRVVVGTIENQTPMMAGFLRYAQVNPYWNIPPDLVQKRIAHHVLAKGAGYLRAGGYQVLDGWDDKAKPLDPASVNWNEVAAGLREVRVRQLPGRDNFMGKVKFMFPNPQGIYLHDTPDRHLLLKDERQFSSGCVRLEDAPRLGKWLLGKPLPAKVKKPEHRVDLPEIVPVYLTYLTASVTPTGAMAFAPDVYGRDALQLAAANGGKKRR